MKTTIFCLGLLFLFLCSCQTTQEKKPLVLDRIVVMDSLLHPWSMAFLSEEEALLTEKDGQLLFVNLDKKEKKAIKGFPNDLADSIRAKDFRDNSGIFDVVLDPDFEENAWAYISYAAKNEEGQALKVIRAKLENDSLTQIQTLFLAQPYARDLFHYGGGLAFGKDKKLYITAGERYYNEIDQPPLPISQDPTDPRGMIHRINPNGSIPEDNPSHGEDSPFSAYAIGIRAAQGIALNKKTGQLWFSEHGSQQGDEINLLQAKGNYGWPIITTGAYRNKEFVPPNLEGRTYTAPKWHWEQTVAPTGILFYDGEEFEDWKGDLLVGGLSKGSMWRMKMGAGGTILGAEELFVESPIRLRKIVQSPKGRLFVLTDEANGKILQVVKR